MDIKIEKPRGIRIDCPHCKKAVIANSRPSSTNHKSDVAQLFCSYFHCHNCGASIKATVDVTIIRKPFIQYDVFEETLAPIG